MNSYGKPIFASESVVGALAGDLTDRVNALWSGPRIGDYLSAQDSRRHLWHAILFSNPCAEDGEAELVHSLTYEKSSVLSERYLGANPRGWNSALGKLGAKARSKELYLQLFSILSRGGEVAKRLHHMEYIADDVIGAMAQIPDEAFLLGWADHLLRCDVSPRRIPAFIWIAERLAKARAETIDRLLASPEPRSFLREQILGRPFPRSPFCGTDRLIPVRTAKELRQIARDFGNCLQDDDILWDVVLGVLAGRYAFYLLRSDPPTLLMIEKYADLGWCVRDLASPRRCNRDAEEALREVQSELEAARCSQDIALCWDLAI